MTKYFARQQNSEVNRRIACDIELYGADIIHSELFRQGYLQKHHTNTTVAEHTLNVTAAALRMCYRLEKMGMKLDLRAVTVGALCHDLGIIGRYEKFSGSRETLRLHPLASVRVADTLVPDIDHKTEDIIRCHMWLLNGWMPSSAEGYIITLADKYGSVRELLYHPGLPLLKRETVGMVMTAMIAI